MNSRTVYDPFMGNNVQVSDRLVDRLRGKYACGPTLASGEPEFGWRQMPQIPIQVAAANRIEELEEELSFSDSVRFAYEDALKTINMLQAAVELMDSSEDAAAEYFRVLSLVRHVTQRALLLQTDDKPAITTDKLK